MTWFRALYYGQTLVKNLASLKGATAMLSSLGVLYTVLKCADYFNVAKQSAIQPYWWVFLGAGVVGATWICRPKLSSACKLKDRDITIEIAVGDLFAFDGALIVGTNTTFDTQISRELIDGTSVQGQFTTKYYGDHTTLDNELDSKLQGVDHEELVGKRKGKANRYPIGTAVKLQTKDRAGYFLAICDINEHGTASGNFEQLQQALLQLWIFIGSHGAKEQLVMPVLGTKFMRLKPSRQVVTQEIIESFIAACSEKTFCERLTIVLHEKDVLDNKIDIGALGSYLQHLCTYKKFSSDTPERTGTAVT
jgi:hypothetical protein